MEYRRTDVICYSPTHTSRSVAERIAEAVSSGSGHGYGVTDFTLQAPDGFFRLDNTVAVVAAPVYGGRLAETAARRLSMLRANDSAAVAVVLYGNRDYEDALVELTDILTGCGFNVVAGAAFIGEHSYSRKDMPVAEGRPDLSDLDTAYGFGRKVAEKLAAAGSCPGVPYMKGNRPYKVKGAPTPQAPVCDASLCVRCGVCASVCPVGAVTVGAGGACADSSICTKCCACFKACPQGALSFVTPYTEMLFRNFSERKEPEMFI